jgi:hypothetical protein
MFYLQSKILRFMKRQENRRENGLTKLFLHLELLTFEKQTV